MLRYARGLIFGSALLALVVLAATSRQALAFDDKEAKQAQKDILELVKLIEAGKPTGDKATEIKKKYEELNAVMHIHKPKTRGGLGVEQLFLGLAKRAPSGDLLTKMKPELLKAATVTLAVADITAHYPAPKKPGKTAKDWKQYNDDLIKSTKEFTKAVNDGSSADIKKIAANINSACNNCHTDFRD